MRHENFRENEYYCVSGSGVGNEGIFIDEEDSARFVFLITHFQSPIKLNNVSWYTSGFLRKEAFSTKETRVDSIVKYRNILPIAFSITPNGFQILLRNLKDGILSVYMHRILTSYSKYYNAKYKKRGHLFGGPFEARLIKNHAEILNTSAIIHKIPSKIAYWENNYEQYPWSSFQDYIGLNRWGSLISVETILKPFKDQSKYKDFVFRSELKTQLP